MNETVVTLIGNVATDVRSTTSQAGVPISSFRVASTTRRFERGKGWTDLDTLYVTVVCWRALAENVAASLAKGDPVVVSGRLRMRQWTADDGRNGTSVELEAVTAGHDLNRGGSQFTRVRAREQDRPGRSEADELAEQVAREPLVPPSTDPGGEVPAAGEAPPGPDPKPGPAADAKRAPASPRARGAAGAAA